MNKPALINTGSSITAIFGTQNLTIREGQLNWTRALDSVKSGDWKMLYDIMNGTFVSEVESPDGTKTSTVEIRDGSIFFDGEEVNGALADRLVALAADGMDTTSLELFLARLSENPSARSVEQLYPFLEHKGIPITPRGTFYAYKSVRADFKDHHSGTILNKPGSVIKVRRNKVSDDPSCACHYGLHVGALEYAQQFGGYNKVIIICEVDPKDVVSIPYDSMHQKMRVCEYKVVGIHEGDEHMPDTVHDLDTQDDSVDIDTDYNLDQLLGMTLKELRALARNLGITNANKIIGGKDALADKVIKYSQALGVGK